MKVAVIQLGTQFQAEIQQGVQGFRIGYPGTKQEASFMARMFRVALKDHNKEIGNVRPRETNRNRNRRTNRTSNRATCP